MKAHLGLVALIGTVALTILACAKSDLELAALILSQPTPAPEFVLPSSTPNPKCVPPCFYGVVPSRTTLTETLSLLKASPEQVYMPSPQRYSLQWKGPITYTYNFILFKQDHVDSIVLRMQNNISFGQIVREHGDPEIVLTGSPGGESAWQDIILVFPAQGLAYMGRVLPLSDFPSGQYVPTSETKVVDAIYFAPSKTEDVAELDAWKGYATVFIKIEKWRGFGVSHFSFD